eukprot:gb/GFBE01007547.1/.p1 GENE.gb/GFBE01007547.1/~~gb/GFBE01007547.1/.p1  ORF type:complete len:139 (+),score=11.29 gb/GFBE01007547.1/:1-417(+)
MARSGDGRFWVGNLTEDAVEGDLEKLFRPFGKVLSVRVKFRKPALPGDANSFAFVTVSDRFDRQNALNSLTGAVYQGRPLKVEDNTPVTDHQRAVHRDNGDSRSLFMSRARQSRSRSGTRPRRRRSTSRSRSRRRRGR